MISHEERLLPQCFSVNYVIIKRVYNLFLIVTQEDVIYLSSLRTQSLLCLQFKQIDLISISIQPNNIKENTVKRVPIKITFPKTLILVF